MGKRLKSPITDGAGADAPTDDLGVGAQSANNGAGRAPRFMRTDLGNSERLVALHGRDLRWTPGIGWSVWNGVLWQADDSGRVVGAAKSSARAMLREAAELEDDDERKKLAAHAISSQGERSLRASVNLAASDPKVLVRVEELDADPWLLNVANGTVDLRTGKLRAHRRGDLITKRIGVEYDEAAECPKWSEFLATILAGSDELALFLQRAVGYSLTGSTREQIIFLLEGGGSNGKSTVLEILRAVAGDFARHTPSSTLLEQPRGNDAIPNDLARLRGVRLVTASETGDGRRINEERVKAISGGDMVTARFMRREWFEYQPQFKLWLATNHLPAVRGTDHAFWRRIRLIPFHVTIADKDQDRDLPAKLRAELPGILAWAVRGCLDWQRDGIKPPAAVTSATAEYRTSMDVVGRFIEECCETGAQLDVASGELWEGYVAWCEANGEKYGTEQAFGRQLTGRGFEATKVAHKRRRLGLRLRNGGL